MLLHKLDIDNQGEWAFVENLYSASFPISERRATNLMLALCNENPKFRVDLAIKDTLPVGFISSWRIESFIFIEHFAITPKLRNEGYGKEAMICFLEKNCLPIILEVELPTTILSERRIGFYQRMGFTLWDKISYMQPTYREEGNAIPMKLMSYRNIDVAQDIVAIRSSIYSIVYNC